MKKKQFIVVGVGRFGLSVIETLSRQGVEVLAIERNEEKLEQIADIVVQAVCADASDPEVLGQIGARNFDGAVVTMGKELETSILVTIQLKELGIPYVMVKATNALGGSSRNGRWGSAWEMNWRAAIISKPRRSRRSTASLTYLSVRNGQGRRWRIFRYTETETLV